MPEKAFFGRLKTLLEKSNYVNVGKVVFLGRELS
jgi:hypothetical protein